MCEYCGCQALRAVEELTREHDHVVNLISAVRKAHQAGDMEGMAALAQQITTVLGPHTQVEEHGLFPPLASEFPDHVTALQDQHRQIEAVLAEAAQGVPDDPTWSDRMLQTVRLLREHILAEQDGVFPAALSRLDTADWEAIDKIRARVGTTLPSPADTPAKAS